MKLRSVADIALNTACGATIRTSGIASLGFMLAIAAIAAVSKWSPC